MPNPSLLRVLARSFLAGEPGVEELAARAAQTLGREWRWLRPLAVRFVAFAAGRTRPRHRDVMRFLLHDPGFQKAWTRHFHTLGVARWLTGPQQMQPAAAAENWNLPAIAAAGDLADRLHLTPAELDWFADLKGLNARNASPRLSHYHYRILPKRSGGVRAIEAPKPNLKALQRRVLAGILDRIPPHPAAHGFVKGRSIRTFVAPHIGRRVVLRIDLQDYFPSFAAARIQAFFRTAGYPDSVAALLTGICTNAVPRTLRDARDLYARPHLPQGAPTSPALANACTYRLDCRLAGLAKSADAQYTRYADDLAFSGDEAFAKRVKRFAGHAAAVLLDEGFAVNHRKTRIMRQGVRQHLAGLTVNRRMNVSRKDFDILKAVLTNCIRLGPGSQNRLHLEGRIGFVETINPLKGERLRNLFDKIQWP